VGACDFEDDVAQTRRGFRRFLIDVLGGRCKPELFDGVDSEIL